MLVGTEKSWARLPELAAAKKTSKTGLANLKPGGLYFFFLFFFPPFPTGETIKSGALKRPELDANRGHPSNRDSETNFTLLLQRTCKILYICIIIFSLLLHH